MAQERLIFCVGSLLACAHAMAAAAAMMTARLFMTGTMSATMPNADITVLAMFRLMRAVKALHAGIRALGERFLILQSLAARPGQKLAIICALAMAAFASAMGLATAAMRRGGMLGHWLPLYFLAEAES